MLLNVYIGLSILLIFTLIYRIFNFNKIKRVNSKCEFIDENTNKLKFDKSKLNKKEYNLYTKLVIYIIFENLYIFFGFFTENWFIYISLLLWIYLYNMIYEDFKDYRFFNVLGVSNLFIKIFIYFYILINHFFIKNDLVKSISEEISNFF